MVRPSRCTVEVRGLQRGTEQQKDHTADRNPPCHGGIWVIARGLLLLGQRKAAWIVEARSMFVIDAFTAV